MINKFNPIISWSKAIALTVIAAATCFCAGAYAEAVNIGTVADNVTSTFGSMSKLITAASYISGLGFAVGSILKFKAHKDNPQQITVGVPIALMFVAAALIFLPSMFQVAGDTLFGATHGNSAGVTGITDWQNN